MAPFLSACRMTRRKEGERKKKKEGSKVTLALSCEERKGEERKRGQNVSVNIWGQPLRRRKNCEKGKREEKKKGRKGRGFPSLMKKKKRGKR